ncbi:hypothetical protein GCM10012278_42580 [Nonomuraea glycinis]|uniref:Uncharacterized protein n=1 Tax=Nonomuraea glycinis TaxID=2047744 RepID=A0A918A714_9ACTN|nr:hypothetical protein GCM10012278_42580 [Nonomuraea glycinis]
MTLRHLPELFADGATGYLPLDLRPDSEDIGHGTRLQSVTTCTVGMHRTTPGEERQESDPLIT